MMYKKIIYLIICSFCFTGIAAQQNSINKLLSNIKVSLYYLKNDTSLLSPCIKSIRSFYKSIPQNNDNSDARTLKQLFRTSKLFEDSIHMQKCKNKALNGLIDSTSQLIRALKKVIADSATAKISLTMSGKNGDVKSKLRIDSLARLVNQITISDTIGNFQAVLFLNTTSAVKVYNSSKSVKDNNFKITQDGNKLIIKLQSNDRTNASSSPNLQSNPAATELREIKSQGKWALIFVAMLFFLLLIGVLLYVKVLGNSKSALKMIAGLSKELKANRLTEEITNESKASFPIAAATDESLYPVQKVSAQPPGFLLTSNTYFICEVMITAGPRKRKTGSDLTGDMDLGEDVCGFISKADNAFMWLLDGTSDDDPLRNPTNQREYFSARLLAQSIGDKLRNEFKENNNESLCVIIENAINGVKSDWLQIIEDLPEEEKLKLKNKIEKKNFPHCSTTVLVAYLQKNGDCSAYCIGDSKMLLFSGQTDNKRLYVETSLSENNENGVDRIFFRLEYQDQSFRIVSNNDRTADKEYKIVYDISENKNIDAVICFSDGIGVETEQSLKRDYQNNPVKAKREIMYQVQGTRDDKSICFIERKEETINTNRKDENAAQLA